MQTCCTDELQPFDIAIFGPLNEKCKAVMEVFLRRKDKMVNFFEQVEEQKNETIDLLIKHWGKIPDYIISKAWEINDDKLS